VSVDVPRETFCTPGRDVQATAHSMFHVKPSHACFVTKASVVPQSRQSVRTLRGAVPPGGRNPLSAICSVGGRSALRRTSPRSAALPVRMPPGHVMQSREVTFPPRGHLERAPRANLTLNR